MAEKHTFPVITISREYGAGGRSVAKELSEKLGIEYYDRDFVKLTSRASGYSEEDVRREGEDMSGASRFFNNLLNNTSSYVSSYDAIYQAERAVILKLAENPCIIVGRCANMILRNEGVPSFDIFLYASREERLKRAIELKEFGNMDPQKYLDRRDNLRKTYYKVYTEHDFGNYQDYNICLDTGKIGKQKCAELLADLLNSIG